MVVRDLETNECWFFLCGTRFSDVTEYTFRAATLEELQVSNKLFLLKCENHFKDRHVWYSLYGMRPWQHGVMTRVERAATCSLFIFMVMITSMMFHGHSHALDGNVLTFGHYSFKWSHIAVGIQSALICFPGPFFISLMFRHAQRRKGNKNLISGNNLESPKLTRGQQNPATSLVQNHDAQKTGNTIKQNNRNRSERENAKVDQNKNKIGQYIPEDNDRPSISREIANIINKQPPKFPGKFEIVNETKRREKTRRNDLSMKKKINSSRVEGDTSRVEKNGATTSSAEKALTSSAVRPSARPPLSAAEAQQEFTILEIDPNTLDPLAIVHFSIYVAWFYIVAAMIASTVICVLYGMTYGIETCRDWLVSFVSAFIQTVIILESFKVVLIAYFSVLNNPRHDLRDWVPPLPPSVRPRSYVNRGAIRRKQKRELTNPTYRSPTRERTNRKKNTQENIEMRLIKQRVPS
ncbi:unnamed protein product [Clavelina lepadiformis]|uniref:Uncharacterized protein n=1 Tax=Clavelina lepadiformis TaxID=159417 RepID=A0ABP0G7R9_CLALP